MALPRKSRQTITDVLLPPDREVLQKAYKLVVDKDIRLVDLANVILCDPALVLEILKAGNQSASMDGRPETLSLTAAITRLGFDALRSLLFNIQSRRDPKKEEVVKCLAAYRDVALRTSNVASIMAKHVSNKIREASRIGGLFLNLGYILALLFLEDEFLVFKNSVSANLLKFRLEKEYNFDVEKIVLKYLRRYSIPDDLVESLNRDATFSPQEKNNYLTRAVTQGAKELVTAFDDDKINSYRPGNALPSRSYIRILPLVGEEYTMIFQESIGYLTTCKIEKARKAAQEAGEEYNEEGAEQNPNKNSNETAQSN